MQAEKGDEALKRCSAMSLRVRFDETDKKSSRWEKEEEFLQRKQMIKEKQAQAEGVVRKVDYGGDARVDGSSCRMVSELEDWKARVQDKLEALLRHVKVKKKKRNPGFMIERRK